MAPPDAIGPDGSQLRERLPQNPSKPQQTTSIEAAKQVVAELNAAEAKREDGPEKRTYGRTPDGTGKLEYSSHVKLPIALLTKSHCNETTVQDLKQDMIC